MTKQSTCSGLLLLFPHVVEDYVLQEITFLLVLPVLQYYVLVTQMVLLLFWPAKAEQRNCYLLFGNLLAQVSSDFCVLVHLECNHLSFWGSDEGGH